MNSVVHERNVSSDKEITLVFDQLYRKMGDAVAGRNTVRPRALFGIVYFSLENCPHCSNFSNVWRHVASRMHQNQSVSSLMDPDIPLEKKLLCFRVDVTGQTYSQMQSMIESYGIEGFPDVVAVRYDFQTSRLTHMIKLYSLTALPVFNRYSAVFPREHHSQIFLSVLQIEVRNAIRRSDLKMQSEDREDIFMKIYKESMSRRVIGKRITQGRKFSMADLKSLGDTLIDNKMLSQEELDTSLRQTTDKHKSLSPEDAMFVTLFKASSLFW